MAIASIPQGSALLPLAGEGGAKRRMRTKAALPHVSFQWFGFCFPHPSWLRHDTFSRKREKEEAPLGESTA